MSNYYKVIFKGETVNGFDGNEVKMNLAKALKRDPDSIEKLFSGKAIVIKKGNELADCEKIQRVFAKYGAVCHIKKMEEPASGEEVVKKSEVTASTPPDTLEKQKEDNKKPENKSKETKQKAAEKLSDLSENLKPSVAETREKVSASLASVSEQLKPKLNDAKEKASATFTHASESIKKEMESGGLKALVKNKMVLLSSAVLLGLVILIPLMFMGGVKDQPLPMSEENIENFLVLLEKRAKNVSPSKSLNGNELMLVIIKDVLEDDMGYNFEKTFRNVLTKYPTSQLWSTMATIDKFASENAQEALSKGYISKRTFRIYETQNDTDNPITPEQMIFWEMVEKCQKKNGGSCDSESLVKTFAENDNLPKLPPPYDKGSEKDKLRNYHNYFTTHYSYTYLGNMGLLVAPDGGKIDALFLDRKGGPQFMINKKRLDQALEYSKLLQEEQELLVE